MNNEYVVLNVAHRHADVQYVQHDLDCNTDFLQLFYKQEMNIDCV